VEKEAIMATAVTLKVRKYIEDLAPGTEFGTQEMNDYLGFAGKSGAASSACLWNEAKHGRIIKRGKIVGHNKLNLWQKHPLKKKESTAELHEEGKFVCHECRKSFSGTELGESILKIIQKHAYQWKEATSKFKEMSEDQRMLVNETKELKQHILAKDKMILSLNRKLSKGSKQVDLHQLNKQFEALPKDKGKGKGDSSFAQT
jgi:hypothetical protein